MAEYSWYSRFTITVSPDNINASPEISGYGIAKCLLKDELRDILRTPPISYSELCSQYLAWLRQLTVKFQTFQTILQALRIRLSTLCEPKRTLNGTSFCRQRVGCSLLDRSVQMYFFLCSNQCTALQSTNKIIFIQYDFKYY